MDLAAALSGPLWGFVRTFFGHEDNGLAKPTPAVAHGKQAPNTGTVILQTCLPH